MMRPLDCACPTEHTECQAFYPVVRVGSPTASPASECCWGETHSPVGEGVEGYNYADEMDSLVLVYYNPFSMCPFDVASLRRPFDGVSLGRCVPDRCVPTVDRIRAMDYHNIYAETALT
jgi:hypothetical protein